MIRFRHANQHTLVLSVHWNDSFYLCVSAMRLGCMHQILILTLDGDFLLNKNVKSSGFFKTLSSYFWSFQVYKNYMSACDFFLFFSWGVRFALAYATCIYIQVYYIALICTAWSCGYLKLCCDKHLYLLSLHDLNFELVCVEILLISLQFFVQHITIIHFRFLWYSNFIISLN